MINMRFPAAAQLLLIGVLCARIAAAQPSGDFYAGRQIDLFVGTPTGGYDQYGRESCLQHCAQ